MRVSGDSIEIEEVGASNLLEKDTCLGSPPA